MRNYLYRCITQLFISILIIAFGAKLLFAREYFLDITIDQQLNITGSVSIIFENTSDKSISEAYFALPMNRDTVPDAEDITIYDYSYPKGFEPSQIKINNVYQQNQTIKYTYVDEKTVNTKSYKNNYVKVMLNKNYLPGEKISLKMNFNTAIPNKFASGKHNKILYLQGFFYPVLQKLNNDGKFELNHDKLVSSYYNYKIKAPEGYLVATGAKSTITSGNIFSGQIKNKISLFSIAASPKYKKISSTTNNITIDSYYISDEKKASESISIVFEALKYYKQYFNMIPPTNYISIVENYMGGTSAYTGGNMIFIPTELRKLPKQLKRVYEVVLVHEVAHLWWGISISYPFDKDNWIGEGLNTFLMNRYFTSKYGNYHNMLEIDTKSKIEQPNYTYEEISNYLPIRSLMLSDYSQKITTDRNKTIDASGLSNTHYNKGLYIFKIIHEQIGEKNFTKLLSAIMNKYKNNPLKTDDLKEEIYLASGKDMSNLFKNWVDSTKTFDYKIEKVKTYINASLNYTTIVKIKNKSEITAPVTVEVIDHDGNTYYETSPAKDTAYVEIISSESMKEVNIDPFNIYPDLYKIDNHYPRRVKNSMYLLAPEADSYYFHIAPSYVITSAGQFLAFKGMYGYLDDFGIAVAANPDYDVFSMNTFINRWPDNKKAISASISSYRNLFRSTIKLSHSEQKSIGHFSFPGRSYAIAFTSEDLFNIEYNRHHFNVFGLSKTLYTEKTGNANSISISIKDRYGLTPLSARQLSYTFNYYRDFIGSGYNFEQSNIYMSQNIRTFHLQSLSFESAIDISNGKTPEQKYYYVFGSNGIKAIAKDFDHNSKSKNRTIFRSSYVFPLISNVYNSPDIAKAIAIGSMDVSIFKEWGALSESEEHLFNNNYIRSVGIATNIHFNANGSGGLSLNLVFAKPITGKNDHKESTYTWLGINGLF